MRIQSSEIFQKKTRSLDLVNKHLFFPESHPLKTERRASPEDKICFVPRKFKKGSARKFHQFEMTKAWHSGSFLCANKRNIKEWGGWICNSAEEPNQGTDVAAEKAKERLSSSSFLFSAAVSTRAHRQTTHTLSVYNNHFSQAALSWLVQEIGKATCEDTAGAGAPERSLVHALWCKLLRWVMRKWICLIYHDGCYLAAAPSGPPAEIYFTSARSRWP